MEKNSILHRRNIRLVNHLFLKYLFYFFVFNITLWFMTSDYDFYFELFVLKPYLVFFGHVIPVCAPVCTVIISQVDNCARARSVITIVFIHYCMLP